MRTHWPTIGGRLRRTIWLPLLLTLQLLLSPSTSGVEEAQVSAEDADFFESQVLPILQSRCYDCHSHDAGTAEGGLVLDSRQGLVTGGRTGPAVVPSSPDESLLLQLVRGDDPKRSMPPDDRLTDDEIATLTEWVRRGLPDTRPAPQGLLPQERIWEAAKTHWAFVPLGRPDVPAGADGKSTQHPVDAFVNAKLASAGLVPGPAADPLPLVRRLYFDLIGLPPTPEQAAAFITEFQADADIAVARLVNELLESPHYGERWGRHWLDLARYSDVSGAPAAHYAEDRLPFAFAYRDYIIRAFNSDKPYDRFVLEQLAADQIPLDDPRDVAGLGFLPLGSFNGTTEDRLAERIDAVGQVFLGLTVGCARCHDHKFDPISAADFYALHGVISSIEELGAGRAYIRRPEDCPIITECDDPALRKEYAQAVAEAERKFREFEDAMWAAKEAEWREQTPAVLQVLALTEAERGGIPLMSFVKQRLPQVLVRQWGERLTAAEKQFHPLYEPWVRLREIDPAKFGQEAPPVLAKMGESTGPDRVNAAVLSALYAGSPQSMADVARIYGELFLSVNAPSGDEAVAAAAGASLSDEDRAALRAELFSVAVPPGRGEGMTESEDYRDTFLTKNWDLRNKLLRDINAARHMHPGGPVRAMVVADQKPHDSHILIRGEADQPGEVVPRRFLQLFSSETPQPFQQGAGRLELAQAIISPATPVTPRVMVNRVWQHHFGTGLAPTPSNVGLNSEPPSHPELLDWLACEFIDRGWSVKSLHRLIMTSDAYRRSALAHPQADRGLDVDPENRLLWRGNIRRLEFEPLRDAVLSVCGTLDPTIGGRSVDVAGDPECRRRTVYAYINRKTLPQLLSTFDFPNPEETREDRIDTLIPTQALFLMNSPFMAFHSRALAGDPALSEAKPIPDRIGWLYQRLFQREPTPQELSAGERFFEGASSTESWAAYIRTLLWTNEFAFVY